MECPYCSEELEFHDYFGRLAMHQDGKVLGDIWVCPNGRKEDGTCGSDVFCHPGFFWTERGNNDDLHEGYPC